jgi:hypothetical protein
MRRYVLPVEFLLAFLTLGIPSLTTNADLTLIRVDPSQTIVPEVGQSFSVNVSVVGANRLAGWSFELYYSNAILNGTEVVEGGFLKSGGNTFMIINFTDNYNDTHGRMSASCVLTGVEVKGVDGNGVLATVKFKTRINGGPSTLKLSNTKLSDPNASPITHETVDGIITVVPEFSLVVVVIFLVIASLSAVRLARIAKRH